MKNESKEWLKGIAVGDTVVVRRPGGISRRANYSLAKVDRLTATQIIIRNEYAREERFRRSDGSKISDRWGTDLMPMTDNVRKNMHEQRIENRFATLVVHGNKTLSIADREAMLAAYDALHTGE